MNWELLRAYLPVGEKNAVFMKELGVRLGVTAEGAKKLVRLARPEAEAQGVIIASSSKGYFIPDGLEELRHYRNMMHKQAVTRLITIKVVNKLIKELEAQEKGGKA